MFPADFLSVTYTENIHVGGGQTLLGPFLVEADQEEYLHGTIIWAS